MTMQIEAMPVPLRVDEDGVVRVGQTRIPIECVVYHYNQGKTPEDIVASFDTLRLADVYAVIAYYLLHTAAVDSYCAMIEREEAAIRQQIESTPEYQAWRERMLAGRVALVDIDCVTVQEVGLRQTPDPDILTWAAEQRRIVLTNDARTMTRYA